MEACRGIQAMADAVQTWCHKVHRNQRDNGTSLVVSGPFGCGKTRALRAAQHFVRLAYIDRMYAEWRSPITWQAIEFGGYASDYEAGINRGLQEDLRNTDVIFIDDIGAEEDRFKSGAATRMLGDLLGTLERKFTFITTNIERRHWATRWDRRVEDRLMRNQATICNLWPLGAKSFAQIQRTT